MLVQLTALLALGVLCRSAPTCTPPHCSAVDCILKEVLSDVKNNRVTVADSSAVPKAVKNKTCMHNNLKTFMDSLAANEQNKKAHHQLSEIYKCEHLFPTVSHNGCETANLTKEIFMWKFETFLKFLYEELQSGPKE